MDGEAAVPGNNLFGIKGTGQEFQTTEYINGHWLSIVGGFRTYDSWEGSVIDHSNFLVENSRYGRAGFLTAARSWIMSALHDACRMSVTQLIPSMRQN